MNIDQKVDIILTELQRINSRLDGIENTVSEIKQDFTNIKAQQHAININRKIQLIAEGNSGNAIRQFEDIEELCLNYEILSRNVKVLTSAIREIQQNLIPQI